MRDFKTIVDVAYNNRFKFQFTNTKHNETSFLSINYGKRLYISGPWE